MPNFQLVNPYIKGDFHKLLSEKNPTDAAQKTWNNLSKYISQSVPKFAFTIERVSDHSLFHYEVKERVTNDVVDYTLEEIKIKNGPKLKKFKSKITELKKAKLMKGGKAVDDDNDDNDDSSSDSDLYGRMSLALDNVHSQPLLYWWYSPLIYELEYIYMPQLVTTIIPYVELDTSTLFVT